MCLNLYALRSYHEHARSVYIVVFWHVRVYGNVVNRLKYGKPVANAIGFFLLPFFPMSVRIIDGGNNMENVYLRNKI